MKIYTNSIARGAVLLFLYGLCIAPAVRAQAPAPGVIQFGAHGAVTVGTPSSSFRSLPGIQNCNDSGSFAAGSGGGFIVAGVGRYMPAPGPDFLSKVGYSLRLGYAQGRTEFEAIERIGSASDAQGRAESVMAAYVVETTIQTLLIEPTVHYMISSLDLNLGASIGYTLGGSFTQRERLVSPSDAQYADGTTERNISEGTFGSENLSTIRTGLTLGAGYQIALTPMITVVPEASYLLSLGSPVPDVEWTANEIRLGVSLLFSPAPLVSNPLEPKDQ